MKSAITIEEALAAIFSLESLSMLTNEHLEPLEKAAKQVRIFNYQVQQEYLDGDWMVLLWEVLNGMFDKKQTLENPESYFTSALSNAKTNYLRTKAEERDFNFSAKALDTVESALKKGPSPVVCEADIQKKKASRHWKPLEWPQDCEKSRARTLEELTSVDHLMGSPAIFENYTDNVNHIKLRDYSLYLIRDYARKALLLPLIRNAVFSRTPIVNVDAAWDQESDKARGYDRIDDSISDDRTTIIEELDTGNFFQHIIRDEQERFALWFKLHAGESGTLEQLEQLMAELDSLYGESKGFKTLKTSSLNDLLKKNIYPKFSRAMGNYSFSEKSLRNWLDEYFSSIPNVKTGSPRTVSFESMDILLEMTQDSDSIRVERQRNSEKMGSENE